MGLFTNHKEKIVHLKLEDIKVNGEQPRSIFDEEKIGELANSIKEHGVLQPIIVRMINDQYQIVAGERRYRASLFLKLETIPAIVKEFDDGEAASIALVENIQREDLTAIEEARAYKKLMELNHLKQDDLAKQLGKAQSTIANKLRLLNLCEEIQLAVLERKITERHARALLTVRDEATQLEILKKIIDKDLTVKETEKLIKKLLEKNEEVNAPKVIYKIPKDIRIAFNTLNHAVSLVEKMGLELKTDQVEEDDYYTYSIRIPKVK
jgi:ParB family transcriptional regulator, chromosome partitioning protein